MGTLKFFWRRRDIEKQRIESLDMADALDEYINHMINFDAENATDIALIMACDQQDARYKRFIKDDFLYFRFREVMKGIKCEP